MANTNEKYFKELTAQSQECIKLCEYDKLIETYLEMAKLFRLENAVKDEIRILSICVYIEALHGQTVKSISCIKSTASRNSIDLDTVMNIYMKSVKCYHHSPNDLVMGLWKKIEYELKNS